MPNPVFRSKAFQAPVQRAKQEQHAGFQQGQTQQPYGYAGQPGVGPNAYAGAGQSMSPDQLANMYQQPSATPADTGRMTYASVINRSAVVFGLIALGAIIGWTVFNPILYFGAALIGLVTGLVNAFKREPSPALISVYAAAQGVFLGGLSRMFDSMAPGVAFQAILATLSVFAVVLALFRSGKVRATPKMTRIVLVAMVGYLVFSLVNFVLMITGVVDGAFGLRSGVLGIAIGIIAVLLASYSLVMDFTAIEEGVRAGAPERYSWTAAFGLAATMIWMYVEILRILAIFSQD
ncbi:Bax inhibitor-1/YccA family protein [Enteractinococcus coprophilus]|uniref:Putative YccA/Bax inhibitor family protein n=1 Tax=Enteractinococcus coprophilus TaxID=1027633 RepID=A0A543AFG4_9MICC|nr:putative YccA/Bax inhibitor family protein [Enteractinococcus coprophilus]